MNEEKLALQREVMAFIKRAAPRGAIAWAKSTEPHRSQIAAAQAAVKGAPMARAELKAYASAFFRAFRAWFDDKYPEKLTPKVVRNLDLSELWHAGSRVTAMACSCDAGPFNVTPRTSADPELAPAFSAAELSLLSSLPETKNLLVEAGLADHDAETKAMMKSLLHVKRLFPGAIVAEVTDHLGETTSLLPKALGA